MCLFLDTFRVCQNSRVLCVVKSNVLLCGEGREGGGGEVARREDKMSSFSATARRGAPEGVPEKCEW